MVMETMRHLKKMKAEYNKKVAELGKKAINEVIQAFFKANPKIKAIQWEQYTPYFNDGDTCSFGVCEIKVSFDGEEFYDQYDSKDALEAAGIPKADQSKFWDRMAKLDSKFSSVEDIMEDAFGDHVQVTVTNDENLTVTIEEYEHD